MIFSYLDAQFDKISDQINLPEDQLKLVFCLLFSYPAGFVFKRIQNPTIRHAVNIFLGLFYIYLIFREHLLHLVNLAIINYVLLKVVKRNASKLSMILSMAYLLCVHFWVYMYYFGHWRIDITASLMIAVCKFTSFSMNYKDGGKDKEKLSEHQYQNRIVELPSIFEYVSYIFFYASVLVGPYVEYKAFDDFMNKRGHYAHKYRLFLASLAYLMSAFGFIFALLKFAPHFPAHYMITTEFASESLLYKLVYINISMLAVRMKYYGGWSFGNSIITACGFNYNPNGKNFFKKYGKYVNVKPIEFEISNFREKSEAWNCSCQYWLKHYVYFRICSAEQAKKSPAKANFASNCTFMTSALWHGLYPGYYLGFFHFFMGQQLGRFIFKSKEMFEFLPPIVRKGLAWFASMFALNIGGSFFVLLGFHNAISFSIATMFIPSIVIVVPYLLFTLGIVGKSKKHKVKSH